tara:strand:- start:794 stop:1927 length:1134 start_codon:yes stop_codon:yes gene_type:complete
MNDWKIPLYKIHNDKNDLQSISNVIKRGMDWAIGPEIEKFEKSFASYIGTKFCVSFNSGTSAGHAALLSLGIKKNDEVIVPSFSFIATANWPLMVNAKPKFVDIEEQTLGLDPTKIESAITTNTKAIIPIHYAGLPCQIDKIKKISNEYDIPLIEDAAESVGASIKNKKVGTFGTLSIFSFAGNKVMTTGEGGAIVTNSKNIFEKLKLIRSHGRSTANYFSSTKSPNYVSMGYNWRMSSITAALANSQLKKINKLIGMRRKNSKYMIDQLSQFNEIRSPKEPKNFKHAFQLFSIRLPNNIVRNNLANFLNKKGIMTKVFFDPIHLTKFYQNNLHYTKNKLKTTEKVSSEILSLPMFPGLKTQEIDYIINSIGKFFKY